nr:unnamed protein product [Callosobruchus chinensis]
MSVESTRRLP